MLSLIRNFLEETLTVSVSDTTDTHTIRLAAAILLVEVMHADHNIDESEKQSISTALMNLFDLTQDESEELRELAEQHANDVISLHEYTSIINKSFQADAKSALLEQIWRVVFSDQKMDKYEEHLVRRIADLLYISHTDYIKIRNRVMSDK